MTPARIESFARRALDGTPYVLTGIVGEGGMGFVFEAEHGELKRRAAIKVLGVSMAHNERAMDRLRREAQVLARLANPHIVDVYDMGFTADGQPYIAMSFINGQDLAKNLEVDGPFEASRVVHIVEQVAEALCDVHAQGMVHRDLKPENIMIEPRDGDEHVVLLDFGIAWVLDADTQITRDGQVMGTPGYIAPEQALGHAVDGRADQYGLAAVVYQLLTGEAAYAGASGLELMTAQLTSPPRPFDADDGVPLAMQAVVLQALSHDPSDRFDDLRAFAAALRASIAERPAPVSEQHPASRPLIFAVIALLALAAGSLIWSPWESVAPDAPPSPVAARVTDTSANRSTPAATPDTTRAPRSAAAMHVPRPASVQTTVAPQSAPSTAPESAPPTALPTAPPTKVVAVQKLARRQRPKRVRRATLVRAPAPPPRPAPATFASAPSAAVSPPLSPPKATISAAVAAPILPTAGSTPPKAAAMQTQLVIGTPVVRGAVSDRPIRKALARSHSALRACVDRLPAPVTGNATIRLSIDADGFLSGVRGEGAPALTRCGINAVQRVRRLRRRPDTGDIQVQLSLRMLPK